MEGSLGTLFLQIHSGLNHVGSRCQLEAKRQCDNRQCWNDCWRGSWDTTICRCGDRPAGQGPSVAGSQDWLERLWLDNIHVFLRRAGVKYVQNNAFSRPNGYD